MPPDADLTEASGNIIACVRVVSVRDWRKEESPWAMNARCAHAPKGDSYCWKINDVVKLKRSLPCQGQLRLWRVPKCICEEIVPQLRAAARPKKKRAKSEFIGKVKSEDGDCKAKEEPRVKVHGSNVKVKKGSNVKVEKI
mmetsp:Transcript_22671/g.45578  ORF Transcript_22671/g.45578 Transcript_22671/m.45578 type:complete len:140 (+) Transcript_22671:127-546(+)